jgi:hypothetical protein
MKKTKERKWNRHSEENESQRFVLFIGCNICMFKHTLTRYENERKKKEDGICREKR